MKPLIFLSFLLVISLQSCTNSTPNKEALKNKPDAKAKADTLKTTDVIHVNPQDENFAGEAARGSMIEIQMGEVMERKGYNGEVKKFAAMMIKHHKMATSQLKEIAAKQKIALPSALTKALQNQVDTLSLSGGREIDHKYLTFMVKAHGQDLKKFEDASKTLQNEELKAFTKNMIPIITSHLEEAKKLQSQLNNTK